VEDNNRDKDLELKFAALEATFQSWQKMSDEGKVAVLETTFETWQKGHDDKHVLEQKAVELAYHAIEGKMVELNDVRHRFVDKEWYEANHGKMEVRITGLEQSRVEKTGSIKSMEHWKQKLLSWMNGAGRLLEWCLRLASSLQASVGLSDGR
jgi:hypothetical protein